MANGGIIGPVNDPTISDLNQTFTASGTFNMPNSGPSPGQADYLVVAGGGGGGQCQLQVVEVVGEDIVHHFLAEQN
jgi:hypothetical protein